MKMECPISEKTLCELIRPYEERRAGVYRYLSDVNPYVEYDIVPLEDPFGPTITERHLQCLIVSEETAKGGQAVNNKRKEKVGHSCSGLMSEMLVLSLWLEPKSLYRNTLLHSVVTPQLYKIFILETATR